LSASTSAVVSAVADVSAVPQEERIKIAEVARRRERLFFMKTK
jgi:hypothetical protein